jgi:hypothetical protein
MSTCLLASIIGRSGPAFSQNTGWLADKIRDKRIYGRFLENGAISVDPTRSFTQQLTRSDICVSDEGHPHFYVWRPLDWPACEHVFFCPGFFVLRVRVWHCETPSLTAETKIELRSSKNLLQKRTPRSGFTIETQRKIPQKKPNSNGSIGFHPRQPVVLCVNGRWWFFVFEFVDVKGAQRQSPSDQERATEDNNSENADTVFSRNVRRSETDCVTKNGRVPIVKSTTSINQNLFRCVNVSLLGIQEFICHRYRKKGKL